MSRRRSIAIATVTLLVALVGPVGAAATLPPVSPSATDPTTAPPVAVADLTGLAAIDHVVVVVEQNHTFDSYFGRYPGVDGLQGVEAPLLPDGNGKRASFTDYDPGAVAAILRSTDVEPLDSSTLMATVVASEGTDRLLQYQADAGHAWQLATTVHTEESAAGVWDVARQSVLFDQYFSSELGGSLPNMLSMLTGRSIDVQGGTRGTVDILRTTQTPTVFDRLSETGHTWRYYVGGIDGIDPEAVRSGRYAEDGVEVPAALTWAPVLGMSRFWDDPELKGNLVDQTELYADAASGRLPDVSFVLPAPTDHPNTTGSIGQTRLLSVLNAVAASPSWRSTAVFVVWDDWGGMFDHVTPPEGKGARVPMMLLSPWIRPGTIVSGTYDHLSILNFIAQRFGLETFSRAQASAPAFDDLFVDDFTPAPTFTATALDRGPVGTGGQNAATLWLYLAFLVGTAGFVTYLVRRGMAGRRGGPGRDDDDDPDDGDDGPDGPPRLEADLDSSSDEADDELSVRIARIRQGRSARI